MKRVSRWAPYLVLGILLSWWDLALWQIAVATAVMSCGQVLHEELSR